MQLIVNNKTNESIPYKPRISLDYKTLCLNEAIINESLQKNVWFLAIEQNDELALCFEKHNENDMALYLIENRLLLTFNNYSKYFIFLHLREDVFHEIKEKNCVNFAILKKNNEIDYYFTTNPLNAIS